MSYDDFDPKPKAKRLIPRKLPVQHYRILELVHSPATAARCENCGRAISWLATVAGDESPGPWKIGLDCAETMTAASDYQIWTGKLKAVKKALRVIKDWEERARVSAVRVKYNERATAADGVDRTAWERVLPPIKLELDQARQHVLVLVPLHSDAGNDRLGPQLFGRPADPHYGYVVLGVSVTDWHQQWPSVAAKLRALGVDVEAPFVPADTPDDQLVPPRAMTYTFQMRDRIYANVIEQRVCDVALAWATIANGVARQYGDLDGFKSRLEEVRAEEVTDRKYSLPAADYCALRLEKINGQLRLHIGFKVDAGRAAKVIVIETP